MAKIQVRAQAGCGGHRGPARSALLCFCLLLAACSQLERREPAAVPMAPGPVSEAQPAEDAPKSSQELVREVQEGLNALGYGAGFADGLVGLKTRHALQKFQETEGLPMDGTVSDVVLGRLRYRLLEKGGVDSEAAQLYAAVPPMYQVGSSYVYSDGRVETVAGVKGDLVRWIGSDGSRFTTHRNFLVPPIYWEREGQSGSTRLNRDLSALWLQGVGQQTRFVAHTTIKRAQDGGEDLEETEAAWHCRALGREQLTAVVGTFDTLKVLCETSADSSTQPARRVWHYERDLNHYLRRSDGPDQGEAAELIAIRPRISDWPPIARAALGRAIEWALNTAEDGQALPWSSSAVDIQVTIAVNRSFRDERGAPCRTFFQVWSDARGKRRYPGVACRGAAGDWAIPGVLGPQGRATAISEWMS